MRIFSTDLVTKKVTTN